MKSSILTCLNTTFLPDVIACLIEDYMIIPSGTVFEMKSKELRKDLDDSRNDLTVVVGIHHWTNLIPHYTMAYVQWVEQNMKYISNNINDHQGWQCEQKLILPIVINSLCDEEVTQNHNIIGIYLENCTHEFHPCVNWVILTWCRLWECGKMFYQS